MPVVSWLLLRGRCRDCAEPISVRYPIVEARHGRAVRGDRRCSSASSAALPAFLFLAAVSVALTVIDLDTMRLPDAIVLPAYPVAFCLGLLTIPGSGWSPMLRAVLGGVALLPCYGALWFFTGGAGIGFGDVKLAGLLGGYVAWLGWGSLVVAGFGAFLLGGIVGIALMVAAPGRTAHRDPVRAVHARRDWIAVFAGDPIIDRYLTLSGLA